MRDEAEGKDELFYDTLGDNWETAPKKPQRKQLKTTEDTEEHRGMK